MKQYKTEGREKLISFLSQKPDQHFTAEEICFAVHGGKAAQSSIYRQLNELCERDVVRKFRDEETAKIRYQYVGDACDCRNHFHAKCTVCARRRARKVRSTGGKYCFAPLFRRERQNRFPRR